MNRYEYKTIEWLPDAEDPIPALVKDEWKVAWRFDGAAEFRVGHYALDVDVGAPDGWDNVWSHRTDDGELVVWSRPGGMPTRFAVLQRPRRPMGGAIREAREDV